MITRYHAMYYARVLAQRAIGDNIDSLSQSLLNAAVDINPHQIEAALFAFRSPLSKGHYSCRRGWFGKNHRGWISAVPILGYYLAP